MQRKFNRFDKSGSQRHSGQKKALQINKGALVAFREIIGHAKCIK